MPTKKTAQTPPQPVVEESVMDDPRMQLREWMDVIQQLIWKYGPRAVLSASAPHEHVELIVTAQNCAENSKLDTTGERLLEDAREFLRSSLSSAALFHADPKFHLGSLFNAREQAWQAARSLSELSGRMGNPMPKTVTTITNKRFHYTVSGEVVARLPANTHPTRSFVELYYGITEEEKPKDFQRFMRPASVERVVIRKPDGGFAVVPITKDVVITGG